MSRMWDTPEFWARSEADEMLREMDDVEPGALADSFERNIHNYDDDPDLAAGILAELRRRAAAGVRFWTGPEAIGPRANADRAPALDKVPAEDEPLADLTDDDMPW
ncbi:hypothetical protein [uncultured Sphingomonas sp.]|uniref:hypothetical protein n=1 Tax=uncultured Sphingomonas sp. TaxID=158754 RepID=UPI0026185011|nr:hypothetical protein [uncultured Sphingomonas sp.]